MCVLIIFSILVTYRPERYMILSGCSLLLYDYFLTVSLVAARKIAIVEAPSLQLGQEVTHLLAEGFELCQHNLLGSIDLAGTPIYNFHNLHCGMSFVYLPILDQI